MTLNILSSRAFAQGIGRAKQACDQGPVVITKRGKPAYVLMRVADYQRLSQRRSLLEALAMPGLAEIEFDPTLRAPT